jgi:lysophospholipase L1-like esterase
VARMDVMSPRLLSVCLVAAALTVAGCAGPMSSGSNDAPAPTIGIGSELNGEVGVGAGVRTTSSTAIDTVVMIGDSITVASAPALQAVYEQLGFDEIIIESKQGKRTALTFGSNPSGVDIASFIVNSPDRDDDHSNELWVVALGTNDINQYGDAAERAAAINEMLQTVPEESPLIWVDTYFKDQPEGADAMNDAISDRVLDRGNSTIARWSSVAADDGNLRDDGVHPREQGSAVFAGLIAATIVDFLELS